MKVVYSNEQMCRCWVKSGAKWQMTHPTYKTYQFQITQFEFKKPIRKKRKNLKKTSFEI